jgi:indole-3-glycerol phosphate synthase
VILDQILAHKREEVARRKAAVAQRALEERAGEQAPAVDFAEALRQAGVRLIAEVKRASPSKGLLRPHLDPAPWALQYAEHGAVAISVLTDERFFQGSLADLEAVKEMLAALGHGLPVLRKDFILDPYQVYEARAAGADAVLLIAAALEMEAMGDLLALTRELGMEALVEVHDRAELERALPLSPGMVGINNRDLHTFRVDLSTTLALRRHVPPEVAVVSESGIHGPEDVRRLARAGVDAMLVGEALVTAHDVGAAVRRLADAGLERAESERVAAGEEGAPIP